MLSFRGSYGCSNCELQQQKQEMTFFRYHGQHMGVRGVELMSYPTSTHESWEYSRVIIFFTSFFSFIQSIFSHFKCLYVVTILPDQNL